MNVKVTCCIFQKYGKPVLPLLNVWYIFAKIFPRTVQKFGIVPDLVFTFQEEPQAEYIRILYDCANSQRVFKAIQMIIKNRQKSKL